MSTRDTWCRHRTPFTDEFKTCKAGVDFHQFKGNFKDMPCLGESDEAKARCPKFEGWTPQEIMARESAFLARLERMGAIRQAIVRAVEETGSRQGMIACPACKSGTVSYSQARNGHVMARCSTDGCASWME